MKKKQSEVNSDNFEPMSELERRLKDVDVSELPDSFRLFGDYSGVDDDEELDDDDDDEEEKLDTEPNQEEDLGFVDDDEEAEKEAKQYIKDKIKSALEPLKELKEWLDEDAYAISFGGEEYKEHLKEVRAAYRGLLKVLRNV